MDIFDNRLAKLMRIASESAPFDSDDHVFELKLGGERVLAYLDRETDLVNAGNRRLLPNFPELASLHRQVGRRCILDGELVVGAASREDAVMLRKRVRSLRPARRKGFSKRYPCVFVAVDILYLDNAAVTRIPLVERQALLRTLVPDGDRMCTVRTVERRGIDFNRLVRMQELPGVVAKRKDSPYRMGRRTRDWVEFTCWQESDFVVCGYIPGEPCGSLVLGQYNDSGSLVCKGKVKVEDDRVLDIIERQPPSLRHPFVRTPLEFVLNTAWIQPRLVCTVGFMSWTVDKQPCNPVFIELSPHKIPYAAAEPA